MAHGRQQDLDGTSPKSPREQSVQHTGAVELFDNASGLLANTNPTSTVADGHLRVLTKKRSVSPGYDTTIFNPDINGAAELKSLKTAIFAETQANTPDSER